MQRLTDESSVDRLADAATAVLLKHGATCPISAHARQEVASFASSHPDLPTYGLEVTENSSLSAYVAQKLGVRHESPQALVLREGKVVWHASHYDITADRLEDATAG